MVYPGDKVFGKLSVIVRIIEETVRELYSRSGIVDELGKDRDQDDACRERSGEGGCQKHSAVLQHPGKK